MARIICDRCSGYDGPNEHDATCPCLVGLESSTEVCDGGSVVFVTQSWPLRADSSLADKREAAIMDNLGGAYCVIARQRTSDPVTKTIRQQTQFQRFVSPEARADATIEDAPVNHFQLVSQIKFLPSEITANPSDLSAMQPVAATNSIPIPQTASTGMDADGNPVNPWVFKPQMIKRGTHRWHSSGGIVIGGRDDSAEWTAAAREEISVKWQKRDDLDAAMLKECRAALAKLREWPRCKDHDKPMSVRCCLPYSGNGKRYAFAGCSEIGCRRASSPVEIELTGPTGRAIGDDSWIAPEFRT